MQFYSMRTRKQCTEKAEGIQGRGLRAELERKKKDDIERQITDPTLTFALLLTQPGRWEYERIFSEAVGNTQCPRQSG
jgi:hypothetical protein